MVEQYPHLNLNVFSRTVGHNLPREVQYGKWSHNMNLLQKYAEYLSPDEISKHIDAADGKLVE